MAHISVLPSFLIGWSHAATEEVTILVVQVVCQRHCCVPVVGTENTATAIAVEVVVSQ